MNLTHFLKRQSVNINRRRLRQVASDFEIPCIIVRDRQVRLVFSRQELTDLIGTVICSLSAAGGVTSKRTLLHAQSARSSLRMVSFRDTVLSRTGQVVVELEGSYALQAAGGGCITVLVLDKWPRSVSDEIFPAPAEGSRNGMHDTDLTRSRIVAKVSSRI